MFCTQCGKQVPDDQLFCDGCGAAMRSSDASAPVEPEPPKVVEAPAVEEADNVTITLNTGDGGKPPKKKKKSGLLGLGVSIAAVVVAAVLLIFNVGAVKSLYNRTVRSPEDYQKVVQKEALQDTVTSEYGEFLETLSANSTVAVSSEMHLKVNEDILSMLENASGMGDMSWLSDVMLNMTAIQDENLTQMDLGLGLKNTEIAALRMIMDVADDGMIYLGLPGLSDQYLSVDLAEMTGYAAPMPMQQFTTADLLKILPDEDTFETLVDRYSELVLSQIVNVEKKAKTVSCNGAEQKVTALTSTITAEELAKILTDVCETMADDQEIRTILENAEDVLTDAGLEADDLYDAFREAMDMVVDELKDADPSDDDYVTLVTYVDYSDNIVGRDVTITSDDEEMEILQYLSLTDGDKTGFSLVIPEADIEIEGEGTRKGDKVNATYSLSVDGMDVGKLELEDVVNTDDVLSGTYSIRPSSEVIEAVFGGSGVPSSLIGDSFALVFEVNCTEKAGEMAIRLENSGSALVSLEIKAEQVDSNKVSVPSKTIDVNDMTAGEDFLMSIDVEKLISKMEEAGIPSELVSIVSYYLNGAASSYDYDY